MRIVPALLITCVICSSLLNSSYFGNVSLTAYFGFCITAVIVSLLLSFPLIMRAGSNHAKAFHNRWPLLIFVTLAAYIAVHGIANNSLNLSHYYWLACAILLFAISQSASTGATFLHNAIIVVAVAESGAVFLQWVGLMPSMNTLFSSTGTWANPNVTAMFLALSLFSQKHYREHAGKVIFFIQLAIILSAIVLLQCRTAYIVTAILLLEPFSGRISARTRNIIQFSAIALFLLLFAVGFKTASTAGRMQIWQNSLQLIYTHPLTGVGFGQFEKEYNAFVAAHDLPGSDHVYMAYNDFLELAIEGGLIAALLWIAFLCLLIRHFRNNSHALALVISFIIIQLTNFGFQAIPVFALFLVYTGSQFVSEKNMAPANKTRSRLLLKYIPSITIILAIFVCARMFLIANAFHDTTSAKEEFPSYLAITEFEKAANTLSFSSSYHENSGDLFMQTGKFEDARRQYTQALKTTSRPDVLGKCGWCLGQLGQYDSAVYYFTTIEKLQPYKYAPRMALLKLYEQKKDTVSIKIKAREIIAMPVKVPGADVDRIKQEAHKWLQDKL